MQPRLDRSALEGNSIILFRAAIRSQKTLDPYERKLLAFPKWANMTADEFVNAGKQDPKLVEQKIVSFIFEEKKRVDSRQITAGTLSNSVKTVRLLLEMNDVILNWRKVRRMLPSVKRYADDRIPTIEELRALVNGADIRGKAMILTFISSGIREGGLSTLKIGDLAPVIVNEQVVAGRLLVYAGEPEQYVTFVTPEAYNAIQTYIEYRKVHGENISKLSPLFRDMFETTTRAYYRAKKPDINNAVAISDHAIRDYFNSLCFKLGFRKQKAKRHEFSVHSLRKWFKTRAESSGCRPVEVEILLDHSVGITDSYYRATENDLLKSYLAIVPQLTISQVEEVRRVAIAQEKANAERLERVESVLQSLLAQSAKSSVSLSEASAALNQDRT